MKSTNQYGVHSPFVYDFLVKCLYDKKTQDAYKVVKEYRNSLLRDDREIEVTDFGAGSRIFKSDKRKFSAIAKNAGISSSRAKMLVRIVNYFEPKSILEIGTSVGLATVALREGNKSAHITTVEGCANTSAIAQQKFDEFGFTNTSFVVNEFDVFFAQNQQQFDFIYFDGNHQKEATLSYFEMLLPTITTETVWIFDDIHWSQGMHEAWEEIVRNPIVTVSIDTFQWGFVFFRNEQVKEHFTVRA